jgi:hypothetical protein
MVRYKKKPSLLKQSLQWKHSDCVKMELQQVYNGPTTRSKNPIKRIPYKHQEDWSKIIHISGDQYFIAGGSKETSTVNRYDLNQVYSDKVFMLDASNGLIEQLPSMQHKRQAQGMCLLNGIVYCCGGLDGTRIFSHCERYSLKDKKWMQDVPHLESDKFSMTLQTVDHRWIYSFGGSTYSNFRMPPTVEIERLDTSQLRYDCPDNLKTCRWEAIELKIGIHQTTCCQFGVIKLNSSQN